MFLILDQKFSSKKAYLNKCFFSATGVYNKQSYQLWRVGSVKLFRLIKLSAERRFEVVFSTGASFHFPQSN